MGEKADKVVRTSVGKGKFSPQSRCRKRRIEKMTMWTRLEGWQVKIPAEKALAQFLC